MNRQIVFRLKIVGFILLITILGFGSKFYTGPGSLWVNNSLAGLFYETFWCLVVFMVKPGLSAFSIASWVFAVTSVLEVMQLWHPSFLQVIRSTFMGSALLGNSFNWLDFPYYLAGCILGIVLIKYLDHSAGKIKGRA
jgi:hypothetical protein